jgi:hypothetical protein
MKKSPRLSSFFVWVVWVAAFLPSCVNQTTATEEGPTEIDVSADYPEEKISLQRYVPLAAVQGRNPLRLKQRCEEPKLNGKPTEIAANLSEDDNPS